MRFRWIRSRYVYLGIIAAVLSIVGLLDRYFSLMPFREPYGSDFVAAALLIVGFVLFGYGFKIWKWPVWLGAVLVMISFTLVAPATAIWFSLAAGLGTISYAYTWQTHQSKPSK